jgi:hypothetical protein
MKHVDEIKRQEFSIVEEEKKMLRNCKEDLHFIETQGRVNEELVQKLGTIISQLQSLREGYLWRIINTAKQNHMLD